MVSSKLSNNGPENINSGIPVQHKQSPVTVRKMALRDVQNANNNLMKNHHVNTPFLEGGGHVVDATKVCGTKRCATECPSSPPCHPAMRNNDITTDYVKNAYIKSESEKFIEKHADYSQASHFYHMQQEIPHKQTHMEGNNMHHVPTTTPNQTLSIISSSLNRQSDPDFLEKPTNGLPRVESNFHKNTSKVPHSVGIKRTDDQLWKGRFLHLQKFLKQCDESDQKDYVQMLLHSSLAELSRHAFELEKRAIQLTIEEGKEMQRVRTLNVLGKSASAEKSLQTNPQCLPRNER